MELGDADAAVEQLRQVSYYRLSGYWYPFRAIADGRRSDRFVEGARLADVVALYEFDERLRTTVLDALAPVELMVRSVLGHALGRLDPCAHLRPELLGALARPGGQYDEWRRRHQGEVERSREDFVEHHRATYQGTLPVWAAVEIMDWGSLTRLFSFAPELVQRDIAGTFALRPPQLLSWLRALNVLRNTCAHHGRVFNRVYPKRPRLPPVGVHPALDRAAPMMNRTFGQLTLVQYLRAASGIGASRLLTRVLSTYPAVSLVPFSQTGAPTDWRSSDLWP